MSKSSKLELANALLEKHGHIFLHLTPATYSVRATIPPTLMNKDQIVFQVGYDLAIPIPDMVVDESGFYGTLSFKGVPYTCTVPWQCVFAIVGPDTNGMVWTEDMPQDVYDTYKNGGSPSKVVDFDKKKTSQYLKPVTKTPPGWGVVKGGKS